jgi:cytochrome P450
MDALLNSDLPPEERTPFRLWSEGQSIVGAGSETTANTLACIHFYLLNDTDVLAKLQAELRDALPDKNAPVTLNVVEKLPYLVCLIV